MIVEVVDKHSGAILFKPDEDTLTLQALVKKIEKLEKRVKELEKLNKK